MQCNFGTNVQPLLHSSNSPRHNNYQTILALTYNPGSSPQLALSAILMVMLSIGRGQLQYFYPFGASLTERQQQQQQQQQQLYQSADIPTQGLPVQVTSQTGLNYLQTSPQEAAPYVPASNVNHK